MCVRPLIVGHVLLIHYSKALTTQLLLHGGSRPPVAPFRGYSDCRELLTEYWDPCCYSRAVLDTMFACSGSFHVSGSAGDSCAVGRAQSTALPSWLT